MICIREFKTNGPAGGSTMQSTFLDVSLLTNANLLNLIPNPKLVASMAGGAFTYMLILVPDRRSGSRGLSRKKLISGLSFLENFRTFCRFHKVQNTQNPVMQN